ncbi:unnamed protein product [Sphagnum jensenii]|uniref:Uncharacterized protein n=1 Tax=Sphagnum jensenii TaxID=128206 RepID=A0ABP0VXS8_9BRYO
MGLKTNGSPVDAHLSKMEATIENIVSLTATDNLVVNQLMERKEERKLNLRLIGFEAKEGEPEKELVQRLNIELLEGRMKLRAKVIIATQQWSIVVRASALAVGTCALT